jgi:NAD(P)H-flavin reductase
VHRVFLRDLHQCWYQKGLPDYGADVPSSAAALKSVVDSLNPSRRVFIGTSSGAFAATLFGALTRADEVLACGPQPSIDRVTRRLCHDNRWPEEIDKARRSSVDRQHVNLVRLLSSTPDLRRISVH